MLEQRRNLSPDERDLLGRRAQRNFIGFPGFATARSVGLYAPIGNEVETSLIVHEVLAAGRIALLPAVAGEGLEFRRLTDPAQLVCGRFGISEPACGCAVYPPEEVDLFLVPGVAFDLSGQRVGFGKGYYDRALHLQEGRGKLVGFCYDFQLLEVIPGAVHDVRMDYVITDLRVVETSGQFT